MSKTGIKLHKKLQELFPKDYYSCGHRGREADPIWIYLRQENTELRELVGEKYEGYPIVIKLFGQNKDVELVKCENKSYGPKPIEAKTPKKKASKKKKLKKKKQLEPDIEFLD